jgi:hypothetical protein
MKLTKPQFSTEMLLRNEVTRDMAKAAGKTVYNLRPIKTETGGRSVRTFHRSPGGRAQ